MRALRNRLILLTVCLIVVAAVCVALFSILFIRNNERRQSEQLLLLLCETGERNLDYYFENVQKSVGKVSSFAEDNLDGLEKEQIKQHVEKVREYFSDMAWKTNGVLTYYYRIDPALSENAEGFWYTNLEDEGFVEQEMTDISGYNLEDPTQLVWFTVPKSTREPVWLPPYTTDSLDLHVISYNVPILWKDQFVGVVGIDIDYSTMAELVESIRLFSDGYAFITNEQGDLVFHPRIDVTQLTEAERPEVPEGLLS